ncbi:acyl-CoA dehydrogenase (plasmid) [Rhodococcus oxybenzonivorans]|uniref:Acyl-[acyl-carrier-protein] dehydrogenase MbtN n=1 Tax=Rhodococcus oxybenzonivorans TaxID=1990687 RepID=A0A2S2C775_9NOCA|nr:acyl-CoA dehydrogenase family protein [Rhodococcus oxybenzonivorans]AWK76715.1 acyl-CoA dehydrogenase [Rhodococcus oxybenzonivorans]
MLTNIFPNHPSPWETPEQHEFRLHTREFVAREVTDNQTRWAQQHQIDREVWKKLGDAGLLCPSIPEEFGGLGGNFGHEAIVQQELVFGLDTSIAHSVHSAIVAHYILAYGSDEQKCRWLPQMASGDLIGAIAMTEPTTGSDLQGIKTTARRDGADYVINGSKTFITNGSHCDLLIIVAKTDPGQGAKGISLIVAETANLPGFERGRVLEKIGGNGQDTRELAFVDMHVPAGNLLGDREGAGFSQLMNQLGQERLIIGVMAAAAAQTAVALATDYARERKAFGKPIIEFQNTRFVLAECKTDAFVGKTFIDYCIDDHIKRGLDSATASMAKLWCSEKQVEVIDRCLQIFGGYGFVMEYPIAQLYAAARVQKIYGGTNEIMKELIGRSL